MDWTDTDFFDEEYVYSDSLVLTEVSELCNPLEKTYTFKSDGSGDRCFDLSDIDNIVDFIDALGDFFMKDHEVQVKVRCRHFGESVGAVMTDYGRDPLADTWCKFAAEVRIECDCTKGEDYGMF